MVIQYICNNMLHIKYFKNGYNTEIQRQRALRKAKRHRNNDVNLYAKTRYGTIKNMYIDIERVS